MVKSVVIISEQSPIGKNFALEAIRIGSGFTLGESIDCKIILMGDAVYLFNKDCDPETVGMDSLDEVLEMADLSDLEVFIVEPALNDAGLTKEDIIDYEKLKIIDYNELTNLIAKADTCFRY